MVVCGCVDFFSLLLLLFFCFNSIQRVGEFLKSYTVGKMPKAFKVSMGWCTFVVH